MIWYILFRLGAFLARRLPERLAIAIVRSLGRLIYFVSPVAESSRDNARHVLGPDADPAQVSDVARRAFENRVLNIYDLLRLPGMPTQQLGARTAIEGVEHVLHVVEQKQGAVVVSAHIGPMEFMIQAVAAYGYPLFGITEQLKPDPLHDYVIGMRSSHGLDLMSTESSLIDVYRRIKRGDVLLSTVDRDSTNTGLVADLFGAPAWLPDGYARIAVRANVPVVFGFCQRTKTGAKGKVYPPVYPNPALDKDERILDVIERTVECLEDAIRQDPGEWHLSTPLWGLAQERTAPGATP